MPLNSHTDEEIIEALVGGGSDDEIRRRRIHGKMEDGVRVITYSTSASGTDYDKSWGVKELLPLNEQWQKDEVARVLGEAGSFTKVKFQEVTDGSRADINFFVTKDLDGTRVGGYSQPWGSERPVVLPENKSGFKWALVHEVGHALGLDHPTGSIYGWDEYFNKLSSVMSYNSGTGSDHHEHFAPYDIFALQYLYDSSNKSPHETLNITNLPSTIHSEKPVTIVVNENTTTSNIELPEKQDDALRIFHNSRLARNTEINHIDGSLAKQPLTLKGNKESNKITGGNSPDLLISVGESDILTGGKGGDNFQLMAGSFDTVITDKNPEDKVIVPNSAHRISLEPVNKNGSSITEYTQLRVYDVSDTLIATALLNGVNAETARYGIRTVSQYSITTESQSTLKVEVSKPVDKDAAEGRRTEERGKRDAERKIVDATEQERKEAARKVIKAEEQKKREEEARRKEAEKKAKEAEEQKKKEAEKKAKEAEEQKKKEAEKKAKEAEEQKKKEAEKKAKEAEEQKKKEAEKKGEEVKTLPQSDNFWNNIIIGAGLGAAGLIVGLASQIGAVGTVLLTILLGAVGFAGALYLNQSQQQSAAAGGPKPNLQVSKSPEPSKDPAMLQAALDKGTTEPLTYTVPIGTAAQHAHMANKR